MFQNKPTLLDCTLRDGGYYNLWDFSSSLINDYLKSMEAISMDYVELGFRSLESSGFRGSCAYTTDNFIRRLDIPSSVRFGVMINADEILKYSYGVESALNKLFTHKSKSPISLVRIACHIEKVSEIISICTWLKDNGYMVALNIMQIAEYDSQEITNTIKNISDKSVDILYFADSMGSLDEIQTLEIIESIRKVWKGELGIHAQEKLGHALSNTKKKKKNGVSWLDCTVTGMGRGPGNVKTEFLVIELSRYQKRPFNVAPLLSLISQYFIDLKNKYCWGTNAYYYLAGKYGIHPSYIQEMLSDSRYRDEDILAVIEHLKEGGGKKFSVHQLETGRNFYNEKPKGNWKPKKMISGRDVLVLGAGPSASYHREALEEYIQNYKPIVIALNTQTSIKERFITMRAASHPVRLLADCSQHLQFPQPLIIPASMLPESVLDSFSGKELYDYGLTVEAGKFQFSDSYCVLPTSLVFAYVLAIAASGESNKVLLAGFDGYSSDDPRAIEVDTLLHDYQKIKTIPKIVSLTPTRYNLETQSIYSLI